MTNKQTKISLVTTCKGRLRYLKDSIKTWINLNYENYDIIIVDYDCPDFVSNFIKKNKSKFLKNSNVQDIKVLKINNKSIFNLCDARNKGIDVADSELILMIDADVHIKNKNILSNINSYYLKGYFFFSNVSVLNTNMKEGIEFFKVKYNLKNIKYHSFLPTHSIQLGLSGTACFIKDIYKKCGKYSVKINRNGWGSHDLEFYLRYLNYYFYNFNNTKKDYIKILDELNKKIYALPMNTFDLIENPQSEKFKFYKNTKDKSMKLNQIFIKNLLQKDGKQYGWKKRNFNQGLMSLLKYKRYKNYGISEWFTFYYYFYLGLEFYNRNLIEKSRTFLIKVLNLKNVPVEYRQKTLFYLSLIALQLNTRIKYYLKRELSELKKSKINDQVSLYRKASILKSLKRFHLAIMKFKKLIKNSEKKYKGGAYFHLGEIYFMQDKLKESKKMFKNVLKYIPDHVKVREYLEKL